MPLIAGNNITTKEYMEQGISTIKKGLKKAKSFLRIIQDIMSEEPKMLLKIFLIDSVICH